MEIIVKKFGGTSVATIENIKNIAQIIKNEVIKGNFPIVVVSAMAHTTNQLVQYCNHLSTLTTENNMIEYDVVVSSGEQVTSGLLALSLQEIGLNARSFLGWQLPIITDCLYANANIVDINIDFLKDLINKKIIPVIAGFQGIALSKRITTLGRGGSDTTAVAIAASIKAKKCYIYSDVQGIYSADPQLVRTAIKHEELSHAEVFEMASAGAKIINKDAAQIALEHKVPLHVLLSFEKKKGSSVHKKIVRTKKYKAICITCLDNIFILEIHFANINYYYLQEFIYQLQKNGVEFTILSQEFHDDPDLIKIELSILFSYLDYIKIIIEKNSNKYLFYKINIDKIIISLIGRNNSIDPLIFMKIFNFFIKNSISCNIINNSALKVSIITNKKFKDLVLNSLHNICILDTNID